MLTRIVWLSSILVVLLSVGAAPVSAQTETIDELYKKALKEDGVLNCYCSLAQIKALPGAQNQSRRCHFRQTIGPRHHGGARRENPRGRRRVRLGGY